jgi:hypothetical protein
MGNLTKEEKPKEIVLRDGITYKLAPLDLNIMGEIEDHFGGKPFAELFRDGSVKPLKYQFWVRLKENHPDLTEERVGWLVTARGMTALQKDIEEQLGIEEEEPEPEKEPKAT